MRRSQLTMSGLILVIFLVLSAVTKGCFCFCFVAGTPIATPKGPVAIEKLRPGDLVWSFDHSTNRIVARKVKRVWRFANRPYRRFQLRNGRVLRMTGGHPVYDATSQRYIPAIQLPALL